MNTPICDFVRRYAKSDTARAHMPGHKGRGLLGVEHLDITEIDGADSLYEASGIIRESEENASRVFDCPTYYSTEGSSQVIRAMVLLAAKYAAEKGSKPCIWAGRNAHKAFLSALALLDVDVRWLTFGERASYLSCVADADELERALEAAEQKPTALYLTSPDYLGNVTDIRTVAEVCHRYGVLVLVDNAHGAYLHFLPLELHPIALGADACADSAHKTLPVLTGGAYLHLSPRAPDCFGAHAKEALSLFGSTSPSYLILQSLDAVNPYLEKEFPTLVEELLDRLARMRQRLSRAGYISLGCEPLKLTLDAKLYGYTGYELAAHLREGGVECEFADPDVVVLMLSPSLGEDGLSRIERTLLALERREPILTKPPHCVLPERVMTPREALLAPNETLEARACLGRVLAHAGVGCPPAVPIVVSGERIDENALACFEYYGIERCCVVKES